MARKHRLELVWPDKEKCEAPEPRILLEKEVYHSFEKGIDDNLLIDGDNLLGLKALERDYTEKIKCIYIDPPYNTKSLFTHYDDSMEHSLWLNMMKERLVIMHRLLKEDGSIWISIDDSECHYLKVMCDEIFGRKNFVANVIWQKKYSPQNDAKWLSDTHDHIIVFAKNKNLWRPNLLPRTDEMNSRYKNPDNDPRGPWTSGDLSVKTYTATCDFSIKTPAGRDVRPPLGSCWRVSKIKFNELWRDNRIWFGPKGKNVPRLKRFLTEVKEGTVTKTIWTREECGDNQEAKREVKAFNSQDIFQTPKPERLVQRIIHLATNPCDIVLDSFAGSGTTGAVAHKMGRRWIMIELGEHYHTHIIPRMEQVIEGADSGGITQDVNWNGGGGFSYNEIAPSLLEKNRLGRWGINKTYNPIELAEAVCSLAGFEFMPKQDPWWMHGYSTEKDYIYVNASTLSRPMIARLSEEVGTNRTLLVYCGAFRGDPEEFPNLTLKKIPKSILRKCVWGRDDYSLKATLESEAREANKTQIGKKKQQQKRTSKISATVAAKRVKR